MRQKLVLSTTTAPASTKRGAHSSLTDPPAEESTSSIPSIASADRGRHSISRPAYESLVPAERSELKGITSVAGKPRSPSTSRIVRTHCARGAQDADPVAIAGHG